MNQRIDSKLEPLEEELSQQDEIIGKLSQSLAAISHAIQSKYGNLDSDNKTKNNHDSKQNIEEHEEAQIVEKEKIEEFKEVINSEGN